ncbi:MAG: M3 family oligoendopeptidase, partial [Bacteroidia bacterium]|nr:M3 family oligoendopeptidase [Bacteroidia bacterium]
EIMDEMIRLRNQIAKNAGFSSYVDYIYQYLGRFDYNRADCESFHAAAELHIKPLWFELVQKRTESLGLGSIRPWDLDVDEKSRSPLVPFQTDVELVEKILAVFKAMDEEFYHFTLKMKCDGLLDVSSRIGKAPGGFNYPLPVTGAPFIFMNATNKHRDVSVLTHELGHAFHTFLSYRLAYRFQSNVPSEVAELASMSMELFASEYWDIFYPDKNDVSRALYDELTGIVRTLLWVACIDAFQHWLYEHPYHNLEARENAWQEIQNRFYGDSIDWSGIEDYRRGGWQKQLHIFEVPFYYIEYGIAQLGALRLWKNYKSNPSETLSKYKEALSLGYTATIPEIYETAGITFDFGADCVKEVVDFLRSEISACENV